MKIVDIAARNEKALASLKRKVAAWMKKNSGICNLGSVTWGGNHKEYWVQVENDGRIGQDHLQTLISDSEFARVVSVEEHDGSYDWAADVYIRPVSIVTFRF